MSFISIEDVQARLPELIEQMHAGEEFFITRDEKTVARLICERKADRPKRQFGTLKGTVLYMAPDFDAPLDEFKDYMP